MMGLGHTELGERLRGLQLVVFDFDGVFTDNRVWVSQDGVESVACLRSDGLGLKRLAEVNVDAMILSTEVNPVVSARAGKLKLDCIQGSEDKLVDLEAVLKSRGLSWDDVAFVGNDINDAACLKRVGLGVVVQDAWAEVCELADLKLERSGGHGAVREFCDLVYKARKDLR